MSFKASRKRYDNNQIQQKQSSKFLPLIKKHQPSKKEQKSSIEKQEPRNYESQIFEVSQEIQKIKNKLKLSKQKKKIYNKLDKLKFISRLKTQQQILQKFQKNLYNQNSPKNYIPIPIYNNHYYHYPPFPYSHPINYPSNLYPIQSARQTQQNILDNFDNDITKRLRTENKKRRQNQSKKYFNTKKLRKILKKVFIAVAYTIFLKKHVKRIRKIRIQKFHKNFLGRVTKQMITINKFYAQCSKKFFILMCKKQDVVLSILQSDSKKVKTSKRQTIKILINSLLDGLQTNIQHPFYQKVTKFLYFICKHGSDIKNNVLTRDQIQTVCISEVFGTLRADKQMQKSQIINTLFIKILIYCIIIQPWKFDQINFSQGKQILKQNCLFIGSVIYFMVLQIQDKYLGIKRQKWYKIGNWNENKQKIIFQQSLIYLNSDYDYGHVISGMLNEQQINSLVNIKQMREQRERIKKVIDNIHLKIVKYHKTIKQQALSKKKY